MEEGRRRGRETRKRRSYEVRREMELRKIEISEGYFSMVMTLLHEVEEAEFSPWVSFARGQSGAGGRNRG